MSNHLTLLCSVCSIWIRCYNWILHMIISSFTELTLGKFKVIAPYWISIWTVLFSIWGNKLHGRLQRNNIKVKITALSFTFISDPDLQPTIWFQSYFLQVVIFGTVLTRYVRGAAAGKTGSLAECSIKFSWKAPPVKEGSFSSYNKGWVA